MSFVHLEAQLKRFEDLCPLSPNSSYQCSEDRVLPYRWHSQCQGTGAEGWSSEWAAGRAA